MYHPEDIQMQTELASVVAVVTIASIVYYLVMIIIICCICCSISASLKALFCKPNHTDAYDDYPAYFNDKNYPIKANNNPYY